MWTLLLGQLRLKNVAKQCWRDPTGHDSTKRRRQGRDRSAFLYVAPPDRTSRAKQPSQAFTFLGQLKLIQLRIDRQPPQNGVQDADRLTAWPNRPRHGHLLLAGFASLTSDGAA
jgi:hypothetical protein